MCYETLNGNQDKLNIMVHTKCYSVWQRLYQAMKKKDMRMPDHSLKKLRSAAYTIKAGGAGYYPGSNFVHVDVGRVRYWKSRLLI